MSNAVNSHFRGLLYNLEVRQFVLYRLERVDRLAELHPILRVLCACLYGELHTADEGRQKSAPVPGKGLDSVFKSFADLAQQVSSGTSQLSRITSEVAEARTPILWNGALVEKPGKSLSTMKPVIPLCFSFLSIVA